MIIVAVRSCPYPQQVLILSLYLGVHASRPFRKELVHHSIALVVSMNPSSIIYGLATHGHAALATPNGLCHRRLQVRTASGTLRKYPVRFKAALRLLNVLIREDTVW